MKNADVPSTNLKDKVSKSFKNKINSLTDQLQMEKEMRENLEYAINEITDHLFTSLEELTFQAEELKKRNLELEIQDKIVKIINQEISLESVLKTLLHQALYLFPQGNKIAFIQYDPLSKQFRFAASEGYDTPLIKKPFMSYEDVVALTRGGGRKLDDGVFMTQGFDLHTLSQENTYIPSSGSMLAMALSFDKKLEDFLILDNLKDPQAFDPSDIKKLLRFREHAISAISKAKILELLQAEKEKTERALKTTQAANKNLEIARKELEEMSLTDPLTKLRNRRFLSTFIHREISKTNRKYNKRHTTSVSKKLNDNDLVFFMLDIDHFKWVNDTFGHNSGDRVLEQIGQLLIQTCRESDILVRWGGEEFLIVYLNSNFDYAPILAERIRITLQNHLFELGSNQTIKRTCSMGFACYPFIPSDPRALDYEQVISIADRCLYISKMSGRNAWVGLNSNDATCIENLHQRIQTDLHTMVEKRQIQISTSIPEIKALSIFNS
ncbi:MAG: GGDEF domain-containing protein [Pseudomonadota bacterium]